MVEIKHPFGVITGSKGQLLPPPREKYGQTEVFFQLGEDKDKVVGLMSGPVFGAKDNPLNGNINRNMVFETRDEGKTLVLVYKPRIAEVGAVRPKLGQLVLSRMLAVGIDGKDPKPREGRIEFPYAADKPIRIRILTPTLSDDFYKAPLAEWEKMFK